jgi:hypothetical protein
MNAFGLIVGLAVAESKGLTGSEATKVGLISAIAPFPMGVVLASVLTEPFAGPRLSASTGRATGTGSGAGTSTGTGTGTGTAPPPAPGTPPARDPAAILATEFAELQAAAAELAAHESQATIDTELARLVEEIRCAREKLDELNHAAVAIDEEAQEETAESEEQEGTARRQSGKSTTSRGS